MTFHIRQKNGTLFYTMTQRFLKATRNIMDTNLGKSYTPPVAMAEDETRRWIQSLFEFRTTRGEIFDFFVQTIICLDVVVLSLRNPEWSFFKQDGHADLLGVGFVALYVAEAAVKLGSLGIEGFFGNAQPYRFIYISDFVRVCRLLLFSLCVYLVLSYRI